MPQVEAVLRGRVRLTPLELIRLIHRVNPSGESLAASRRAERYRLKARLQSLLLREHGESLVVEQDRDDPRVISLRLKHFDEDACHALLPELEDDARSLAQRMLDEGADDRSPLAGPAAGEDAPARPADRDRKRPANDDRYSRAELLALARQALEEYDFEQCERFLRQACRQAGGDPEPCRALLEFYLDHLAAYDRAVELGREMERRVRKDEGVRGLLALAHARAGQPEEAVRLLARKLPPRGSEACLYAGLAFADRGDLDQAMLCYHRLQPGDLPDLQDKVRQLAGRIEDLRAEQARPLLEAMEEAYRAGDLEGAQRLAEELLRQDPGRQEARRIRELCHRRRQEEKVEQLLARADGAHARGDHRREAELLRRIMEEQGRDQALEKRLRRALEKAEEQDARKAAAEVQRQLEQGRLRAGLQGFLDLPRRYRQEVAAGSNCSLLSAVEQILETRSAYKPGKIVEAVMALAEAEERLDAGEDPDAALALLDGHARILAPVREAALLRSRALERLQELEQRRVRELFRAADQAVDQAETLRHCIDELSRMDLAPAQEERLRGLQATLHALEQRQELEQGYASALSRRDHLTARHLARELAGRADVDAETWQEKADFHQQAMVEQWRLASFPVSRLAPAYHFFLGHNDLESRRAILVDEGRQAVAVASFDRLLALYIVDVRQQRLQRVVALQTPAALKFPEIQAVDDTLWISGEAYAVQVAPWQPDILAWHDYSMFVQQDELLEEMHLFPRQGYAWLNVRSQDHRETIIVVNMATRQVERRFPSRAIPMRLQYEERTEVVDAPLFPPLNIRMLSPRGTVQGEMRLSGREIVCGATFHPDGNHYLLALRPESEDDYFLAGPTGLPESEEERIRICCLAPDGRETTEPLVLENMEAEGIGTLHAVHGEDLVVFCGCRSDGTDVLCALRPETEGLKELYQVALPEDFLLAQDERCRRISLLLPGRDGVQVVVPGQEAPVLAAEGALRPMPDDIPEVSLTMECGSPTGQARARVLAEVAFLESLDGEGLQARIREARNSGDPDAVALLIQALQNNPAYFEVYFGLKDWFVDTYPSHPDARIILAEEHLRSGGYAKAVELLADLSPDPGNEGVACHVCHLLGMGYLGQGNAAAAVAVLEQGTAMERGECDLAPLLGYARACVAAAGGDDPFSRQPIPELARLFRQVDHALDRKEWQEAIALLEGYSLGSRVELQLLARFAEAFLQIDPGGDGEKLFARRLVLSCYCEAYDLDARLRSQRLLAPLVHVWSPERLEDLFHRAKDRLSENKSRSELLQG